MKATSKIIAAAVAALGVSAFAVPASADFGDYGQHVYTNQSQSRFAPEGFSIKGSALPQINRSAKVRRSGPEIARQGLFDRLDAQHKAY